jgi:flavin-dependent dehydrogenase
MVGPEAWLNTGIVRFPGTKSEDSSLSDILRGFLSSKRKLSAAPKAFEAHPIPCFHPSSVFASPRIVLVGDAAGVDPLLGEGVSFGLGYGEVAAESIRQALEREDFSFTFYKADVLDHEIGQALMDRLGLAEGLYRSEGRGKRKDLLRSVLLRGYRTAGNDERLRKLR